MKHGQRPQVHGVLGHVPLKNIGHGVDGRATVVIDHALGVAGGAAGVVQRNRVPLVGGRLPGKVGVAHGHKLVIRDAAQPLHGARVERVLHINHQQRRGGLAQRQRLLHDASKFRVNDDNFGLSVIEHEGYGLGVQPGIERIEHRARGRNAEMRLNHRRRVGQHHRHGVALAYAVLAERAGQLAAAAKQFSPVSPQLAMHDGQPLRVDLGGALNEGQRRQRREIGLVTGQVLVKNAAHAGCSSVLRVGCP